MNRIRFITGLAALTPYGFLLAFNGQSPSSSPKISYPAEIAPIFKAHCESCHSGASSAADLDLSSAPGLNKGGVDGKVIQAGNPDGSTLLDRILGKNGKPRMPMGFPALADEDIAKIRTWIAQGASTVGGGKATHWAYVKPIMPPIPAVHDKRWIRNEIDAFVLANLEKNGLKPSPEASRETLIRRVSLDLTGLPPSPKEIDAFLADKKPDAYGRLVGRLLASPHYGERMARPWLDLARYADSDGYEKDLNRTAYLYRDWVIDAYNKNLPYDQFTVDQLAGDLLPKPTVSELIATGFNRNTMNNREGGVDRAEAQFLVVLDRVNTTSTVWLGSTLGCARCHDHKYDPFTQKDYYSLCAFYNNAAITKIGPANVGEQDWFEPEIKVPSAEQSAKMAHLSHEIADADRQLQGTPIGFNDAYRAWRNAARSEPTWTLITPEEVKSDSGATMQLQPDDSVLATGKMVAKDVYRYFGRLPQEIVTGLKLEALADSALRSNGPGRAGNGNFVLTKLSVKVNGEAVPIAKTYTDFTQEKFDADGIIEGDLTSGWAVSGQLGKNHTLVALLAHPVRVQSSARIEVDLSCQSEYDEHVLGRFRISATASSAPEATLLPPDIRELLGMAVLNAADSAKLEGYYRGFSPLLADARSQRRAAEAALKEVEADIPTALVMKDNPGKSPLTANIHNRGEFLSPTAKVTACTPASLPPMKPDLPRNRLGLAQWLVSKDNPLTARVEMNRVWELFFGRGIVEPSEDFGTQGAKPSNQELLDWLATEFMRRNWDTKAMVRLIVTSATYRQSSKESPKLAQSDPQNVLLARCPRFRMEAEMIRDVSLSAGGILSLKMGGPSVMPLQPEGVWNTPYNNEKWTESKGEDAYRRGIYTFWKRSSPYASFLAFDATTREECTVRRIRTNTPLQALAMLNDQMIFKCSRGLARRMISEGGEETAGRLAYGFRACTGRYPTKSEIAALESLLAKLKETYGKDTVAAKEVSDSPTDAAYTMVANVLLNLDETITKG